MIYARDRVDQLDVPQLLQPETLAIQAKGLPQGGAQNICSDIIIISLSLSLSLSLSRLVSNLIGKASDDESKVFYPR